jgi:hypothetical protein
VRKQWLSRNNNELPFSYEQLLFYYYRKLNERAEEKRQIELLDERIDLDLDSSYDDYCDNIKGERNEY